MQGLASRTLQSRRHASASSENGSDEDDSDYELGSANVFSSLPSSEHQPRVSRTLSSVTSSLTINRSTSLVRPSSGSKLSHMIPCVPHLETSVSNEIPAYAADKGQSVGLKDQNGNSNEPSTAALSEVQEPLSSSLPLVSHNLDDHAVGLAVTFSSLALHASSGVAAKEVPEENRRLHAAMSIQEAFRRRWCLTASRSYFNTQ